MVLIDLVADPFWTFRDSVSVPRWRLRDRIGILFCQAKWDKVEIK